MSTLQYLIQKVAEALSTKKGSYILALFIFILIFIGLLRSYSASSNSKNRLYHIGQDPQWYGANLLGKERNMTAFSDELLLAIAKKEELKIQIDSVHSDELMGKLENGDFDGILSNLTPNFQNQDILLFSEPYFLLGPVLIVPIQSDLNKREKMAHKIIGVPSSSPTVLELENNSAIRLKLYDNILQALGDLDDNQIDGVLFPALPSYTYTQTFYPNRLKIATPPLTDEGLRLVTLKNKKGEILINHFDQGLSQLKSDYIYQDLLDKWDLVNTEKDNENELKNE